MEQSCSKFWDQCNFVLCSSVKVHFFYLLVMLIDRVRSTSFHQHHLPLIFRLYKVLGLGLRQGLEGFMIYWLGYFSVPSPPGSGVDICL